MKDLLVFYNNQDSFPMVNAIENLLNEFDKEEIDILKLGFTLPGVALYKAFMYLDKDTYFTQFNRKDAYIERCIRENIVGGASIAFHRYHKANETFIKKSENICKKIISYDLNSLYLFCLTNYMPVGAYTIREKETNFKPIKRIYDNIETKWLDWIMQDEGIHIIHKCNSRSGQFRVGPFLCDGYCPETNTIFEFLGCYYHPHSSCPLIRKENYKIGKFSKEMLENRTELRFRYLKMLGYNIVFKRECEFKQEMRENYRLLDFVNQSQPPLWRIKTMNENQILDFIENNSLFGMIRCDISTPDHLKSKYSEFPPIFINEYISRDMIGPTMLEIVKKVGYLKSPKRMLISSFHCEQKLFITPLIKFYLEIGLKIRNITLVIQYTPKKCFEAFANDVCKTRREADKNPNLAIRATQKKLLGNSVYGKATTDKSKYNSISYCNDATASQKVCDPRFKDITELYDGLNEVVMSKKSVRIDTPLCIGFFVLNYSKLIMLEFYYNFLLKYLEFEKFQLMYCDTDSFLIALNDDIKNIVKAEMMESFKEKYKEWFPRDCCDEHKQFDKRTLGLMKIEYSGIEAIVLSPKCYAILKDEDNVKFSSKGVNKSTIIEIHREL